MRVTSALLLRQRVPYITLWSEEEARSPRIVLKGTRIGFRNEKPTDRDAHGILWRRVTNNPGQGRPLFSKVHATRQRRAMGGLLCQMCTKPTMQEATSDGVLFLLSHDEYEFAPWPAPIMSTQPPVCVSCAWEAVMACPHLRGHWVAVRGKPLPHGVMGIIHRPGIPGLNMNRMETVPFGGYMLRWMEAAQLVVRMERYKVVDLDTEIRGGDSLSSASGGERPSTGSGKGTMGGCPGVRG